MTKETYVLIESFMRNQMKDSAHDQHHVYRVLYNATEIATYEEDVDYDVLITSCLLHDIGRAYEINNPGVNHAEYGAEMAYTFLQKHDFDSSFSLKVKSCIQKHRFRSNNPPLTLEEKILFDADKLDVSGAIGIARTLLYQGKMDIPLYTLDNHNEIEENNSKETFFTEYKRKLESIYDKFYTKGGRELAKSKQESAATFYNSLKSEISDSYKNGFINLKNLLK